jgi:hypothetical protein
MTVSASLRPTLVVPSLPPIDKYVAALRPILDGEKEDIRYNVEFCNTNIPSQEDFNLWTRSGYFILVDVGERKYHKLYPSATDSERHRSLTHESILWNRFLPLINFNNRSGFLKNLPHSIAAKVRTLPHTFIDRSKGERETWHYGMEAVRSYFRHKNRRQWETLRTDPDYADLYRMWNGFGAGFDYMISINEYTIREIEIEMNQANATYPYLNLKLERVLEALEAFTLPGYFRHMFLAGDTQDEILKVMSWWLDHEKMAKEMQKEAHKKNYSFDSFEVAPGSGAYAAIAQTENYFQSQAILKRCLYNASDPAALAIIRMPTGGVLLTTSLRHKLDMTEAYQLLQLRETGRWHVEGRFAEGGIQMAMNQSWQYIGVKPTDLGKDDFISLTRTYGRYHGRAK